MPAPFDQPDLRAMREVIPPEPEEPLREWIKRCLEAVVLMEQEAEQIRSLNKELWESNEPYKLPTKEKSPKSAPKAEMGLE